MSPPEQHSPPPGAVPLDTLIKALQACRAEPGVSGGTPVRIVPEFGSSEVGPGDALFASGAAVTYPAGSGWADYQPWVVVEYRREHLGELVPDEASETLLDELAALDRALVNALRRDGYTVARLQGLKSGPRDQPSWYDLEELPNVGPVRLLLLVNFFRKRGIEFEWFAAFDEVTATWKQLKGRDRVPRLPAKGLH